MGSGLGKYPSKYFVFSIIGLAILGGFLLYNSQDVEAISIGYPPTSAPLPQDWTLADAPSGAVIALEDDTNGEFITSSSNNDVSCFGVDTGLDDSVQFNGGVTLQVIAEKTIAKGQTKIRLGTSFGGSHDQGQHDIRLNMVPTPHTRDFPDIDTAGEVHERDWCIFMQTDAKIAHALKLEVIADLPDVTAPTLTGTLSPAANGDGWNNTPVTVTWTCVDEPGGSGVPPANVPSPETYGDDVGEVDTNAGEFSASCSDNAGNPANESVSFKIDQTPPTVNDIPADIEEQAETITGSNISYTDPADFSDNLSGVDSFLGCTLASGSDFPIQNNVVTCSVQDVADNIGSDTFNVLIHPFLGFGDVAFSKSTYYLGEPVVLSVSDPSKSGTVEVTLSSDSIGSESITFELVETAIEVGGIPVLGFFTNGFDNDNPPQLITAKFDGSASSQEGFVVQAANGRNGFVSYPIPSVGSATSFDGPVIITGAPSGGGQVTASLSSPFRWTSDIIEKNAYAGFTIFAKPATATDPASIFNPLCSLPSPEVISVEVFDKFSSETITVTATERTPTACVFDSDEQILFSDTLPSSNSPATLLVTGETTIRGQPVGFTEGKNAVVVNPFILPSGGNPLPTTNIACPIGQDVELGGRGDGFCATWENGGPDGGFGAGNEALLIPKSSVAGTTADHIYPAEGGCTHLYVDARRTHVPHAVGTAEPAGSHVIYHDARNLHKCFDTNAIDIALEVQPMRGHIPKAEAMLSLVDIYQNAPSPSTDCPTCPGPINLHVFQDKIMGNFHIEKIPYDAATAEFCGVGVNQCPDHPEGGYKQLRDQFFGRNVLDYNTADCPVGLDSDQCNQWITDRIDARHQGWRMMMFVHQQWEIGTSSGRAEIPGDDSMVSLGKFISAKGDTDQQLATALHESAHLVGNNHNGRFDDPTTCNGNHYSALNYYWQFNNFDPARTIQLSDELLANLDENDLDEPNAIRQADGTPVETAYNFLWRDPFSGVIQSQATVPGGTNDVDWNLDGDTTDNNIRLNINNIGITSCANDIGPNRDTLYGANDWAVQNYLHRSSSNFVLGVESLNPLDPLGPDNSFAFFEVSTEGGTEEDPPTAVIAGIPSLSGFEGDDIVLDSSGSSDSGGTCGTTATSGTMTTVYDNCILSAEISFFGHPTDEEFDGMILWDLGPNEANGILDEPGTDARSGVKTPLFLKDDETSNGDDGIFNIGLAVWDANGNGDTALGTVTITNVAPSVSVVVDSASVNEGDTVTMSPSTFSDPGIDDIGNTATKDWGDGSAVENCTNAPASCLTETAGTSPVFDSDDHTAPFDVVSPRVNTTGTVTGSHTYLDDSDCPGGICTIEVIVTDKDGGASTDGQLALTVQNVAPIVTLDFGGDTINEGQSFAAGTGSFTDPGADTWTATIDYGDGGGAQPLALSGKTFTVGSHTYDNDTDCPGGVCTVTVTVDDGDGGIDSATVQVTVNNIAPEITLVDCTSCDGDDNIVFGLTANVDVAFTDAGGDLSTVTISWGDGSADDTILNVAPGTISRTHNYAETAIGPNLVTVTVDDGSGPVTDTSLNIGVIIGFPGNDPILAPINNAKVQLGRTLPVTFVAQDSSLAPITTLTVRVFVDDLEDALPAFPATRTPTPDNNIAAFDPVTGEYRFQMETGVLLDGPGKGREHLVIVAVMLNPTDTDLGDTPEYLQFSNSIFVK